MVKPGLTKPSRSQATVNNTGPAMAPSASQRAGSLVAEGADADERSNDEVATGLLLAFEIGGWVANEHRTRGVGDQAAAAPSASAKRGPDGGMSICQPGERHKPGLD